MIDVTDPISNATTLLGEVATCWGDCRHCSNRLACLQIHLRLFWQSKWGRLQDLADQHLAADLDEFQLYINLTNDTYTAGGTAKDPVISILPKTLYLMCDDRLVYVDHHMTKPTIVTPKLLRQAIHTLRGQAAFQAAELN